MFLVSSLYYMLCNVIEVIGVAQQDMLGEGIGTFGKSRNERDTRRKREYSSPARFAARETDRSFRTPVRSNCFETNGRNGRDTRALNVPNEEGESG
jgi:hypothetical protein